MCSKQQHTYNDHDADRATALFEDDVASNAYHHEAQSDSADLRHRLENANRALLALEVVLIVISTTFLVTAALVSEYAMIDDLWKAFLVGIATFLLILCIVICIAIELKVGYFECSQCGYRYVPAFKDYMMAVHMGWWRKMRCPSCGNKNWHRKVLSK